MATATPSALEQLTAEQQADIKKMSSERIRMVLSRAGGDIDTLAQASRQDLIEEMAKYNLSLEQAAASDKDSETPILSYRHRKLLERQMKFHELQAERQFRLQQQQFKLDKQKLAFNKERQSSLAARVEYYGDALKFSTIRMTDEPGDLPHFFTSLENVFAMYEVPNDLRAKLMIVNK